MALLHRHNRALGTSTALTVIRPAGQYIIISDIVTGAGQPMLQQQ